MSKFLLNGIGALALVATAVGLSLWLNQPRPPGPVDIAYQPAPKAPERTSDAWAATWAAPPPQELRSPSVKDQSPAVRQRDPWQELRQTLVELIEQDIQVEREALEALRKQLQDESQPVGEGDLARQAAKFESLPAETAARELQQMAEAGKFDTVVRIIAAMNERHASRVVTEIPDPALAVQLLEKLRGTKKPAPASAMP